jgi:hypothetical protein
MILHFLTTGTLRKTLEISHCNNFKAGKTSGREPVWPLDWYQPQHMDNKLINNVCKNTVLQYSIG